MMGSMMRRAMLGDGSTLSLDFTTGVLDPRLSFTRSTSGTYIGSDGYIKTMAAAPTNDPTKARFDYDPTAIGTPRGLLIEGSATNICTYSGDMTQSGAGHWTQRVNLDTSAWTGFTAPDGTATAVKLIPNTTNGLHNIQNVGGSLTLVAYTASAFVKADGRTVVGLAIGGSQAWQNFVLTGNGSLGSASTSPAPTSTITPVGSTGWYRVTMTWTSTLSAVGVQLYVTLPQTSSTSPFSAYAGDGTQNGVQAWGYQLELGSGASSYIPTGASTGSRAADVCYITNADYGFTTTGGTYFVEWERGEYDNPTATGTDCFAFSTDYASGRWLSIYTAPASTTTTAGAWTGGINQSSTAVSGRNRAAVSYAGWNATTTGTLSVNGSSPTTSATMALGTTPTYLMIGAASQTAPYNGGGLRDILGNRVRRLKYWPSVLPSATLQAITVNT